MIFEVLIWSLQRFSIVVLYEQPEGISTVGGARQQTALRVLRSTVQCYSGISGVLANGLSGMAYYISGKAVPVLH